MHFNTNLCTKKKLIVMTQEGVVQITLHTLSANKETL